jgi:hypothetical protein
MASAMGGNSTPEIRDETGIDILQACWLKDGNSKLCLSAMNGILIEALLVHHGAWLKGVYGE